MKAKDLQFFYEKYFQSVDRRLTITTVDNEIMICCIIGVFYKNDEIYQWHVAILETENYSFHLNNQLHTEKVVQVKSIVAIQFGDLIISL